MTQLTKEKAGRAGISCFLISVVILGLLSVIIAPKSPTDRGGTLYYQGQGFLAEEKNSLDVIFFGNSNLYASINPVQLKDETGISAYTSGAVKQNMAKINTLLEESLKNQSPKVAVLEVDCLYETSDSTLGKLEFATTLFQYHARWKDLSVRDFTTLPSRTAQKDPAHGFVACDTVCEFEKTDYMGSENDSPLAISQKVLREVKSFIETCKKNNIQVVFLSVPSPASWSYQKHNAVNELAKQSGVPFADYNIKGSACEADSMTDYRDKGNHLNSAGAKKATAAIGEYLTDNFEFLNSPSVDEQTTGKA